jgi:hypothetical protein
MRGCRMGQLKVVPEQKKLQQKYQETDSGT